MSYLKALPRGAALLDVFRAFPHAARPLLQVHQAALRDDSPLSVAQREMIAGYVSALNGCGYCEGIHGATATSFGLEAEAFEAAVRDLDTAPLDDDMKALLRYVEKLTRTPSRLTEADADAVFAAGWDERAFHDAVFVASLFNMMNRLVDGLGIEVSPEYTKLSSQRLHAVGYAELADLLDAEE